MLVSSNLSRINGGFLQWGSPNKEDASKLLADSGVHCVVVAPAYRLNVFGFLASSELQKTDDTRGTVGNLGFWDQRCAIEWTFENIGDFGGDKRNITVGGLSAGAYSTFHQLAHELALPDERAIIWRVILLSNGIGLQPKPISEVQEHFNGLFAALDISNSLGAEGTIAELRALSWKTLVEATWSLPENSFRAVTDGGFISHTLHQDTENARFAKAMLRRGIKIMIGDLQDEQSSYKLASPPTSHESLLRRLCVKYPEEASEKTLLLGLLLGVIGKTYSASSMQICKSTSASVALSRLLHSTFVYLSLPY